MLSAWRELIFANRRYAAIFGIARWKRVTMDALLWDGTVPIRYAGRNPAKLAAGDRVLAWQTRVKPEVLADLRGRGVVIGEIEDGMIRSNGLGANCVPPLSVIVDEEAAHFDPSRPSRLETILQNGDIPPEMVARAAALRQRLVAAGISKYGADGREHVRQTVGGKRRVLVAAQVEDDRAVLLGGAGCTNRALLARARECEPEAHIIFKPHPDVEAGHRRGAVPEDEVMATADAIERRASIGAQLAGVDAIHVISSLAGFEALLRGAEVTTHGVPFYAGWGLTRDLGPAPARRNRQRTLDELVAAVLILYPRYLDPVTRLPCGPEVLVERMAAGQALVSSPLVALREMQGRVQNWARGWGLFYNKVLNRQPPPQPLP
jgi:capsular polysaccharide export protein